MKYGDYKHYGSGNIMVSDDLAKPSDQEIMWLYWQVPIKVTNQPAKFGGPRQCENGDMYLVCHVISQNHVIKLSGDFIGRNSSS